MDDHEAAVDADRTTAAVDDGDVVRSAHSSPSRGRRKITWLSKVTRSRGVI